MNLEQYGITVERTPAAGIAWRVVNVEKIPNEINGGKHNIYVNAFGANADRWPNAEAYFTATGSSGVFPLDKRGGPMELGHGNTPMYKNNVYSVVMNDSIGSDIVHGLHSMHPDEGSGATWGHHSFRITFQRALGNVTPPPDETPPTDTGNDDIEGLRIRVAALEADNKLLRQSMQAWIFGD